MPDLPLLSICIPTCNRCELLKNTLLSIICDPVFVETDNVEVVVLDNVSTDETESIVQYYLHQFPTKIIYKKTESFIEDERFERCLRLARGRFRKLQNDNFIFKDGSIAEIVKILNAIENEKPLLFFANGHVHSETAVTICQNISEFVKHVSFHSTWICGFGIWKDDLEKFEDISRYLKLQLVQVDIILRTLKKGKRAIVINVNYFASQYVSKKGGYNIAKVFGANYLFILKEYLNEGLLDLEVFQEEKKKLLKQHIAPYYFDVKKEHNFFQDGFFQHLTDYWRESYFYEAISEFLEKFESDENSKPTEPVEIQPSYNLAEIWRKLNPHNDTNIVRGFDFKKVTVGRKTYGTLEIWTWWHEAEGLSIGNFVSIGDGTKFILGGNHPYTGFSTFPFKVKYFDQFQEAETKGPIKVEDDVWIGLDVTILSGVTIGRGAVIGAGSVVAKSIPPYSIAVGAPAKVVAKRFSQEIIDEVSKIDFASLSDAMIVKNREILYNSLTSENVVEIVDRLRNI